jgi:uncharacterized protein YceH (UPF0502 family)
MELVEKLPRQPGRKESRYTHLLSGKPQEKPVETIIRPKAATEIDRISELQEQIDELRREVESLRDEIATFRSQFD